MPTWARSSQESRGQCFVRGAGPFCGSYRLTLELGRLASASGSNIHTLCDSEHTVLTLGDAGILLTVSMCVDVFQFEGILLFLGPLEVLLPSKRLWAEWISAAT